MIGKMGEILDQNGDGGDSCNFTCCGIVLGVYEQRNIPIQAKILVDAFWNAGNPVRHPTQTKKMTIQVGEITQVREWKHHNNPKNFTRDQATLLFEVASPERAQIFLEKLKGNHWFLPNTERDIEGSVKKPYPHFFINDSWQLEFSWFDHADFATPDFVGFLMVKAGIAHEHPWFMKLAHWWCKRSIDSFNKSGSVDFKQIYFTAKAFDLHGYLAKTHPHGLRWCSLMYFKEERALDELHWAFLTEMDKEGLEPFPENF
jgi:hypothetical protein